MRRSVRWAVPGVIGVYENPTDFDPLAEFWMSSKEYKSLKPKELMLCVGSP